MTVVLMKGRPSRLSVQPHERIEREIEIIFFNFPRYKCMQENLT